MTNKEFQPTLDDKIQSQKAILKAIELAGSGNKLAAAMKIKPGNISYWKNGSKIIPLHRALQISTLYPEISLFELRPDFTLS